MTRHGRTIAEWRADIARPDGRAGHGDAYARPYAPTGAGRDTGTDPRAHPRTDAQDTATRASTDAPMGAHARADAYAPAYGDGRLRADTDTRPDSGRCYARAGRRDADARDPRGRGTVRARRMRARSRHEHMFGGEHLFARTRVWKHEQTFGKGSPTGRNKNHLRRPTEIRVFCKLHHSEAKVSATKGR